MTAETSNSAGKTLARTAKGSHRINAIRIKSGANSLGVRLALDVVWPSGVPEGLRAKIVIRRFTSGSKTTIIVLSAI